MKTWGIRPGFMRWVVKPFLLLVMLAATAVYTEHLTNARAEQQFKVWFEHYLEDSPQRLKPQPRLPATAVSQVAQTTKSS